ncbi:MAG: tetratricopeptide repeat protein [Candidatus Thorarchaeota archaeon]|jgi:tetratricopeptide (TPR) repeat protein
MSQQIEDMDPAEILEQAASALESGDNDTAAKMFNAVGNIYMSVAEFEEAHKCFEDSLKIYQELKDETGVCDTMYNLGVAQINLEQWDEAISTLQSAKKMFEKSSNDSGAADALYGLALATLGQGSFDTAMGHFKKAQKEYKKLENQQGVASVIMDMGAAYVDKENWTTAETTIKKALKVYREIEDKSGIADACSLLGDIAETSGNQKKAAEMFVEAAQNYYESEIFDIAREVLERAEQKMWDVPKSTRRRLRRVIDDLIDALPEETEPDSGDEDFDEELLEFQDEK